MIKKLPEETKKELDVAFKTSKDIREQGRIQLVRLLSKGQTHEEVIEILGTSEGNIRRVVGVYNKLGIDGLRAKPHPRNNSKLSIMQKDEIKDILITCDTPSKAGLKVDTENDFWSMDTLRLLTKKNTIWNTKETKLTESCLSTVVLVIKRLSLKTNAEVMKKQRSLKRDIKVS